MLARTTRAPQFLFDTIDKVDALESRRKLKAGGLEPLGLRTNGHQQRTPSWVRAENEAPA
jgi:hypothetical protein